MGDTVPVKPRPGGRPPVMRPVLLACLLLAVTGACRNPVPAENPKKEILPVLPVLGVREGTHQDLGKVMEGTRVNVTFTLVNTGKAEAPVITLEDLSKGGCSTISRVSSLSAGDSAKLEFLFETLGYGGKKETREVEVRYGNPELSPLRLSVTAEVLPVEPWQVPIGELHYNFFILLDVRDEAAFREGHIAGAIHVPADRLLSWAGALPRDFLIYLCSQDGSMSDSLARQMQAGGFSRALSMVGGIQEWERMYGERVIIKGTR